MAFPLLFSRLKNMLFYEEKAFFLFYFYFLGGALNL